MALSSEEFLRAQHVLRESLTLESLRPLGQTKYGGYSATVASHFEGYVYDIEASINPVEDQLDVFIRCNAFALASEQDAIDFFTDFGNIGNSIFSRVEATVECAWNFVTYKELFYYPCLRLTVDAVGRCTQSEIIEILEVAKVLLDDVFPIFKLASEGSIGVVIALSRMELAFQASIGGCAH